MSKINNSQASSHLKLRESSVDDKKLVNDRGDRVTVISPTQINVNGNIHGSIDSAAKAISKWGK